MRTIDFSQNRLLYHYTSAEALENILKSKRFWLGSSKNMDDPKDQHYGIDKLIQYLNEENTDAARRIRDTVEQEKRKIAANCASDYAFFSISFGRTEKNQDLWEQYANHQRGICIEFNEPVFVRQVSRYIQEQDKEAFTSIAFPEFDVVQYDNGDWRGYVESIINRYWEEYLKETEGIISDKKMRMEFFITFIAFMVSGYIKSEEWSNQNEVRLLYKHTPVILNGFSHNSPFRSLRMLEQRTGKKILKKLGLLVPKQIKATRDKKKHLELRLNRFWSGGIVSRIYVETDTTAKRVQEMQKKHHVESITVEINK